MRDRVRFVYDPLGNCNQFGEGQDGELEFQRSIQADTVIEQAGAYFLVRRFPYAGKFIMGLVRVSWEERNLPIDELREKLRGVKGSVLFPDKICLMALDKYSLNRGLIHPIREELNDKLSQRLRAIGRSRRCLAEVEEIQFYFADSNRDDFDFIADPSSETKSLEFGNLKVTMVSGGSWLILRRIKDGGEDGASTAGVMTVLLTPHADREDVVSNLI